VRRLTSLAVLAAVALGAACSDAPAADDHVPAAGTGVRARVTRVVDGDTVEVDLDGREIDVRLIGIDTPESVAPGEPVECYAAESSAYTEGRLEARTVRLEFDVERLDPYGRTLAYVWVGEDAEELFNETLVAEGYAVVTTFPPNVRYVERFVAAQHEARRTGRGLWSACP
jgi:micrococcal nuclease